MSNGNIGIGNTNPLTKLSVDGEISSTNANSFRSVFGNYGTIFRNDGLGTYLLLTNSGDQYGNFNALRPFSIDNLNGNTQMGNNALFINHGGNVGIGLANTSSKFGVAGGITVDKGNVSNGLFPTGLQFGSTGTGEGIVSKKTAGGNQFGLDLITGGNARLTILNNGNVGIGVASPSYSLETKNRIRLRDGGSGETAGIWLNKAGNTGFGSFVGMTGTDNVGMYSPSLDKFTSARILVDYPKEGVYFLDIKEDPECKPTTTIFPDRTIKSDFDFYFYVKF
jgi:hypothetical protein